MTIAGEYVERVIEAREGTVYITARNVYKVFGKKVNPYDIMGDYHEAQRQGVPVPGSNAKFTAELVDGQNRQTIQGVVSTRAFGTFFQLSKRGGESILTNQIRAATNRPLLAMLIEGLEAAAEAGVSDPQGFVNPNSNPPLCFIDIHMTGRRTHAFDEVIRAARERLESLG